MNCVFDSCGQAIELAEREKTFGVFYSENAKTNLEMHVHDCCEVFLALSDGTGFLIDDRVYEVKRGDLFIMNPFEAHKVSAVGKERFERFSMHVHPAFLYENSTSETNLAACFYAPKRSHRAGLSEEQLGEARALLGELCREREYGDDVYKRSYATFFLLLVNRAFAGGKIAREDRAANYEAVGRAIYYVNAHYAEDISLRDVAEHAYVSVNQLTKLFRVYCSTTVGKYLTGKRISEAKKLLLAGKSVTDAGLESGFNDYANFIRRFKSSVGVSPGKYAKDGKKEIELQ